MLADGKGGKQEGEERRQRRRQGENEQKLKSTSQAVCLASSYSAACIFSCHRQSLRDKGRGRRGALSDPGRAISFHFMPGVDAGSAAPWTLGFSQTTVAWHTLARPLKLMLKSRASAQQCSWKACRTQLGPWTIPAAQLPHSIAFAASLQDCEQSLGGLVKITGVRKPEECDGMCCRIHILRQSPR